MAQIGAIWIGTQRFGVLCERYGAGDVEQCLEEAIDYGSRRTGADIKSMASGRYTAEGWMDSDGHRLDVEIRCTVIVDDEHVDIDFDGSAEQATSGTNPSLADLKAGGGIPVMLMIDPDTPHNEGCLRRVRVTAPKGSICNAAYPASTAMGTTQPTDVMRGVACKALIQIAPQRVPAGSSHISHMAMLSGTGARSGTHWGHLLLNNGGGAGAACGADGWPLNATSAARGGLKTASAEHTELLYPVFVEEWEIEPNSMGLGEYNGGPGIRFSVRPLYGPMENMYNSDGLQRRLRRALHRRAGARGLWRRSRRRIRPRDRRAGNRIGTSADCPSTRGRERSAHAAKLARNIDLARGQYAPRGCACRSVRPGNPKRSLSGESIK